MVKTLFDKIAFVHVKERRVLVALNEGSDVWYLPGGHREPGETDTETLVREVKEELSVDIIPDTIAYLTPTKRKLTVGQKARWGGLCATRLPTRESLKPVQR